MWQLANRSKKSNLWILGVPERDKRKHSGEEILSEAVLVHCLELEGIGL